MILVNNIFWKANTHNSHIHVCQALLLLALREFGVGAQTQAWLYAGGVLLLRTSKFNY